MTKNATGDLKGTTGLQGGSHHVIAYRDVEDARLEGRDRPLASRPSTAPRRALAARRPALDRRRRSRRAARSSALLARRSRREIEERGEHAQSWSRLTRSLAVAATPAEVADALLDSVQEIFTDAVAVIAVDTETGQEIRATSSLPGWRRVPGDTERLRAIAELAACSL